MNITASTKLCMIIGSPVEHSLSPAMHNAAFAALGIDNKYVYVGCEVRPEQLDKYVGTVKVLKIHGISCTTPLKEAVLPYIDYLDPVANQIGAVNTIVNSDGKLHGYNTDWLGIIEPLNNVLRSKNQPSEPRILLIGAGGAARAAAYGLAKNKYNVSICNRTLDAAQSIGDKYNFQVVPQDDQITVNDYDIIINTVSSAAQEANDFFDHLGRNCHQDHVVFDISYGLSNTFAELAKKQQATIIDGREMLLYQGIHQFRLFTGYKAPENEMRKAIGLLSNSNG